MDRAITTAFEYSDDDHPPQRGPTSRKKWRKRRGFATKNPKANRPATYMGQRSNNHPRHGR